MSSSKEVKAFVQEVTSQPGWDWSFDGNNHVRITNPSGKHIAISSTPSDSRWKENELGRLRRILGYDPDAAKDAKRRQSAERLRLDRERGLAAMERAEREALARQRMADEALRATQSGSFGEIDLGSGVLKGWPTSYRYITAEQAQRELDRYLPECCLRRSLTPSGVRNWISLMESGAFRMTGSPIVYSACSNQCMLNGVHRFTAIVRADQEKLKAHYPQGVPFLVLEEFPRELMPTLDSGNNRTQRNLVELTGREENASAIGTAVRLAMLYDKSFEPGGLPWTRWSSVGITNTEFELALRGDYASVGDWVKAGSRLWTRTRMVKSAGTVLYYLLDRDGEGPDIAEEFFSGVMGEATTGDPRAELRQSTLLLSAGRRKQSSHPGAQQLGMALYAYGRWRVDPNWRVAKLKFESDQRMWPVYQPGMEINTKDGLRFPYNKKRTDA